MQRVDATGAKAERLAFTRLSDTLLGDWSLVSRSHTSRRREIRSVFDRCNNIIFYLSNIYIYVDRRNSAPPTSRLDRSVIFRRVDAISTKFPRRSRTCPTPTTTEGETADDLVEELNEESRNVFNSRPRSLHRARLLLSRIIIVPYRRN